MYAAASQAYLESRVLSAKPVELIRLLYEAAIERIREARRHLAAGEIGARSRSISRAIEILLELIASLDQERGGALATRLLQLYDYIYRRLMEANFKQADPPLAEALVLLATLSEAWGGVCENAEPGPARLNPWSLPAPQGAALNYAPQSWSL